VRRVLDMPVGRFQVLLEAARRRRARLNMEALMISAYPHMTEDGQQETFRAFRDQAETEAEREARWNANWDRLGQALTRRAG
jgi:hypothetical protein